MKRQYNGSMEPNYYQKLEQALGKPEGTYYPDMPHNALVEGLINLQMKLGDSWYKPPAHAENFDLYTVHFTLLSEDRRAEYNRTLDPEKYAKPVFDTSYPLEEPMTFTLYKALETYTPTHTSFGPDTPQDLIDKKAAVLFKNYGHNWNNPNNTDAALQKAAYYTLTNPQQREAYDDFLRQAERDGLVSGNYSAIYNNNPNFPNAGGMQVFQFGTEGLNPIKTAENALEEALVRYYMQLRHGVPDVECAGWRNGSLTPDKINVKGALQQQQQNAHTSGKSYSETLGAAIADLASMGEKAKYGSKAVALYTYVATTVSHSTQGKKPEIQDYRRAIREFDALYAEGGLDMVNGAKVKTDDIDKNVLNGTKKLIRTWLDRLAPSEETIQAIYTKEKVENFSQYLEKIKDDPKKDKKQVELAKDFLVALPENPEKLFFSTPIMLLLQDQALQSICTGDGKVGKDTGIKNFITEKNQVSFDKQLINTMLAKGEDATITYLAHLSLAADRYATKPAFTIEKEIVMAACRHGFKERVNTAMQMVLVERQL